MAGLSLFGDLESPLLHTGLVSLRHRLESVKVVEPNRQDHNTEPDMYGATMAAAVAEVEIPRPLRPREFSLPVSANNETYDGKQSSWSAALDALAFGTDIQPTETGVALLGRPNSEAARLFVAATGNVHPEQRSGQFLEVCDITPAQDPSQAWNVLTIGGYTNLTKLPAEPVYHGCSPLAPQGELSPHSRTSATWGTAWPIRLDIVLEAGNVVVDGSGGIFTADDLELVTTSSTGGLTTANATSAATAQAARLAALALDHYPALWPGPCAASWSTQRIGHPEPFPA